MPNFQLAVTGLPAYALVQADGTRRHARQGIAFSSLHGARMSLRLVMLVGLWWALSTGSHAEPPIWVTKICRVVPTTPEELEVAHQGSTAASLQVAVGEPLEITDWAGKTTYDISVNEGGAKVKKQLDYDFCRLGCFTYGMQLSPEDQLNLPVASKNRILDRVGSNYISIQLRVHRQHDTGTPYLYFKPFAAIGAFGKPETQEFHALMEDSVRDLRSLGLFVKAGTPITAESLRTFVAVNRDVMTRQGEAGEERLPHFELAFVRARFDGDQPVLHCFVTNEHRQVINYLAAYVTPQDREQCTFDSSIVFTEYTVAKQSPSAKATRQVVIDTRGRFDIAALDAFAQEQNWGGTALENLTQTLDAMIDGKVAPRSTGNVVSTLK
jgi:hypothetical protein